MPPVFRYVALPTGDGSLGPDEKRPELLDACYQDEDDAAAFFDRAARSSNVHRRITLVFVSLFATCYILLFGANLPDISIPDELRAGSLCSHRPQSSQSAEAISGYEQALLQTAAFGSPKTDDSLSESHVSTLESSFFDLPTAEGAREALKRYTKEAHVAGQDGDYNLALLVLKEWAGLIGAPLPAEPKDQVFDAGSPQSIKYLTGQDDQEGRTRAWTDTYSVWLNYPINSSLTLSKPASDDGASPEPYFTASLKEDVLDKDPTSSQGVPVFHGYSASGSATGQVVFAGMGRKEDFEGLAAAGIDVKGKVVLVSYGGVFRGLKVRAAQEAGAVACLIYSDTIEDGEVTIENGYEAYPDGPARNPSAVQRGSVQGLSFYPGDPSTPEKPSYRNATRLDPEQADSLPKIPSLPISYQDAKPLLESLKGKGKLAKDINNRLPGALPGVEYWTGPSDDVAHVENYVDLKVRDIWNTYAVIPGLVRDEVVVLGNHRDAWTFGAADPNSGTAAFHETIKGLGALHKRGWRPLRTIVLASWDAEEYGLVGSTEFGEDYADWIRENVVVYHNVDVSVSGSKLEGHASPSLAHVISSSAAKVDDPNFGNGTKLDVNADVPLGSGSDFTVFLQYLGIASTDLGFSRAAKDPIYHYHSNYDSFYWMDTFGDPGFKRHEASAKVVGVTALQTSSSLFTPINVTAYAYKLSGYLAEVEKKAHEHEVDVDLSSVYRGIQEVQKAAVSIDAWRAKLVREIQKMLGHPHVGGRGQRRKLRKLLGEVRELNRRVRKFESGFIDPAGLAGRPWYKHLGVAPGRWLGYGATTLPGLTEAIVLDAGKGAQEEAERLAKHLHKIGKHLDH